MAIVIDDRQQRSSPRIHEILLRNLTIKHIETQRLEFGDYAFTGQPVEGVTPTVGIEYCTLSDYLNKIASERLAFQLAGMMKLYNVPVLLVVGRISKHKETGKVQTYGYETKLSYAAVKGLEFSAQLHGVKYVNVEDQDEAGLRIVGLYRYFQENPEDHKFFREQEVELGNALNRTDDLFRMPIGDSVDRAVKAIMAVSRGVGETLALAALHKYGSVEILMHCNQKQLQEIPGWGPIVAKSFHETATKWYGDR